MATRQSPRISCINWLDEGPLAPHGQAYKQYLVDRACAASTFGNCLGGVALGPLRRRFSHAASTSCLMGLILFFASYS